MTDYSLVNNCYRAILAQVNQLDSMLHFNPGMKGLYEELTELAFYLLEDDRKRIIKGINQVKASLTELEEIIREAHYGRAPLTYVSEIRTHLDFLIIQFSQSKP